MEYREVKKEEMNNALELVWNVYLEYEAVDYSEEGIAEFRKTLDDSSWINARKFYGAFIDDDIIGVIATKDKHHIALLFVDGKYHRQGIGKNLFRLVSVLNEDDYFTVNSTPYAHEFYKHLGFCDTNTEQCVNGMRFYPMKKIIN